MSTKPNTRDPLAVYDDEKRAHLMALEIYGPLARSLGYSVSVRRTHRGTHGIFLVDIGR